MEAVRVPPSACSTSQSISTVRSPSAAVSTTARMERPIRRWISCVRPEGRPLLTSRGVRLAVARGSMEYSAVTQPLPVLRRNGGTRIFHGGGAQHLGVAHFDQGRTFRGHQVAGNNLHRAEAVRVPVIRSHPSSPKKERTRRVTMPAITRITRAARPEGMGRVLALPGRPGLRHKCDGNTAIRAQVPESK